MEQLSDLVKLREIGALTNEEYNEQRQVIVDSMRKLQTLQLEQIQNRECNDNYYECN